MKLKLKNTPEQVELIKAMGSRDNIVAAEASQAFAAFIGPVVRQVLSQAGSSGLIFSDLEFDEDDSPSLPLDLWYDENEGTITVWSQSVGGGLPTSEISGMNELKVATYRLDSAVSWLKRYSRRARLDIVSKGLERMSQEVLLKQERNAWAVILKALADATTNSLSHVMKSGVDNKFFPADLSGLMTLIKRINTSFASGTPADWDSRGLTDMFVSPEVMEQIRGFAFEPVSQTHSTSTGVNDLGLPEGVRDNIWRAAGMTEMYGVVLHELLELGAGKKYNTLFNSMVTASSVTIPGHNSNVWQSSDEILVGVDLSRDAFVRPLARHADGGGTFSVFPDDQFVARSDKQGFYGFLEEGRVCIDARAIVGISI